MVQRKPRKFLEWRMRRTSRLVNELFQCLSDRIFLLVSLFCGDCLPFACVT